ncbi:hypothetical protein HYH03_010676 [Edaphochlamys debaryana]|uniref:FAS1 domain-containing protein n=1 Tax=Edaphochlamys debaryana TaxID=47281 RepID=A0A836BXB4_9CHLO|nr:hypothetical protein HYH03_010676 [Edaphochlamys debaryana]|eukprot:KAG2491004.1 hypothetical protein HYH03_010676 [Edaphochlamys debaryana]
MSRLPLLALCALLALSDSVAHAQSSARSPAEYICGAPDLATLCKVIKAAGNGKGATRLKDTKAIDTIFAPLDGAFYTDAKKVAHELGLKTFEEIFTKQKAADRLLQNIIIPNQAITSAAFKSGTYKSLLGQKLTLSSAIFTKDKYVASEEIKATIKATDFEAGRSIIHKVDRVPVPDDFL